MIKLNVSREGFSYNVIKGIFNKGSVVSSKVHPVEEVELLKQRLLKRGLLANRGKFWVTKKPIYTGLLMALNLNSDFIVRENPFKDTLYVDSYTAKKLEGQFPEKDLWVTDSELLSNNYREVLKVKKIFKMDINNEFLVNHESSSFGNDEKFVLQIFQEQGIISPSARHGVAKCNEADIVDEQLGQQYEVIYEVKNSLKKDKLGSAVRSPEMLLVQMVNNPYIHSSEALLKKLYDKQYTEEFVPNLIILNCGCGKTTDAMMNALANKIKNETKEFRTKYHHIFILTQNFIDESATLLQLNPAKVKTFECSNEKMGFIRLKECEQNEMTAEDQYLAVVDNIFNHQQGMRYDTGKELRSWFRNMRMW